MVYLNLKDLKERISSFFNWNEKLEIKEAGGTGGQITNANIQNFIVKAVGNIEDSSNGDFAAPEIDLSEIKDAVEADSYLKLAVMKYHQLIFKAGYNIVSDNDQAAEYIESRLRLMSFVTDTPMDILFQQVAEDLVTYSNAFLIKSRVEPTQLNGIQAQGVLDAKPVGGYFRVDPTTMKIKRDKTGTIKQYEQSVGNNEKKYKNTDVVHFYIDKPGGAAFGVPRIEAALEDVRMLRKIEGNVLRLIYRFTMPLYQMQIGLPEQGLMATDKEIKEARSEMEKLSDDGLIITNERTKFVAIGAEGTALDASGYLKYFEQRVFSALNLSNAMVGRGGSKQDADSMEEQVHDSVKFFQRTLQIFIENLLFNEMLLEGGYDPISNPDDIVYFQFNEINLETKVKMETHALNKFQGNANTFEEMRQDLGLYTDSVDETRLFANMIQQKNALELEQTKASLTGATPTNKTSGSVKSTVQPKNQHGTTTAKVKESMMDISESLNNSSNTEKNIEHYKENFKEAYKRYNAARNEICGEGIEKAHLILPLTRDAINKEISEYIKENAYKGYKKAIADAGEVPKNSFKAVSSVLENRANKTLTQMFKDINSKLKGTTSRKEREAVFDSVEYRLRFLSEHIASKSYWYGYVKTCSALNIKQVYVDFGNSEDKENHDAVIHTDHFSLDDIPTFHAYCTCKVSQTKVGEK